ncbi:hypothetical protein D3C86_1671390 [compost metagenome]
MAPINNLGTVIFLPTMKLPPYHAPFEVSFLEMKCVERTSTTPIALLNKFAAVANEYCPLIKPTR